MIIKKIKNHFGAYIQDDIKNFNINRRDELIDYISKYKILIFKRQDISPEQFVDFCEILGTCWKNDSETTLGGNGELKSKFQNFNKLTRVSNKNGVLQNRNVKWHNDISHKPWNSECGTMPFRALLGHIINDNCVSTWWMDQEWLYQHLSDTEKDIFNNFNGIFKSPYNTKWNVDIRKVILKNPISDKIAINMDEVFLHNLVGWNEQDFNNLKLKIIKIGENSENLIEHVWEKNDVIIYNNYNTAHRRDGFSNDKERTLLRATFQIEELIPKEFI